MMTIDEIYEFDLNGYIIYKNVLSSKDVEKINAIIVNTKGNQPDTKGKFSFFELDLCFIDLMAHPRTIEILKVMLGDWLRFDHALGIEMTETSSAAQGLHAGLFREQGAFWYQWLHGHMYNGLIKVIYALNDVKSGDGGFVCIPGSHKSNLDHRPKFNSHLVVNPALEAGDMLIFTEALVHGSKKWIGEKPRRVLIYSYAPGCLGWKSYDSIKHYLELATNDLQRDLLKPPYVGDYDEHLAQLTGKFLTKRRTPLDFPRLEPQFITETRKKLTQIKYSVKRLTGL